VPGVRGASRLLVAVMAGLVVAVVPSVSAGAAAAPPQIHAAATPTTVQGGSSFVVSGSVSPVIAGVPVVLQRRVGLQWRALASQQPSATGGFAFTLVTPWADQVWLLRVSRVASPGEPTVISGDVWVRVTKAHYGVSATAASPVVLGQPLLVKGSVTPLATGWVELQKLVGGHWVFVVSALLARDSTFVLTTHQALGSYNLRVVKPAAATIAVGISPTVEVTVAAPG
jgi:hypothetical protein